MQNSPIRNITGFIIAGFYSIRTQNVLQENVFHTGEKRVGIPEINARIQTASKNG